jgi:pimeloyl-ACP methyl ester carboxylesterase
MLVFLHRWPDSAALWKAQVAHFSGRFRTVVVQFPAFGNDRASAGVDFPVLAKRLAATLGAPATPRPPHVVVGRDWGAN